LAMHEYTILVSDDSAGKRLDVFLMDFIKANNLGISRTYLKELMEAGNVHIQGAEGVNAHHKVRGGETIVFGLVEKQRQLLSPEDIALDILYEDEHLAIINKPPGLVVHPAPGNPTHTLVNAIMFHLDTLSSVNPDRPGIVHRLDKGTSGVMVVTKTNTTHLDLARQFEEHSITRRYVALVKGSVAFDEDIIEASIARDENHRENMKVDFSTGARYARTRYRVLKRLDRCTYVELEPFTGRTHQLRVHMAYIGHPIMGDTRYGRDNAFERMALHAKVLGFIHPATKKYLEFTSEVPKEFTDFIKKQTKEIKTIRRKAVAKGRLSHSAPGRKKQPKANKAKKQKK
jgi:23S rRNA pseudouridine1911/1915/1917 synthase